MTKRITRRPPARTAPLPCAAPAAPLICAVAAAIAAIAAVAACAGPAPPPPPPVPEPPARPDSAQIAPPPAPEPAPPPDTATAIENERALQMEAAVLTRLSRLQRLHDLSLPLLRHGLALCGGGRSEFGFRHATLSDYPDRDERRVYETILGVGPRPTVLIVIAGSAADRAGLAPGDVIAAAGEVAVGTGRSGAETVARTLERWPSREPLPLQVERGGEPLALAYRPDRVCDYGVALADGDDINAWATGDEVLVGMGLMRFLDSDRELQAAVAHEIAHNSEGHLEELANNLVLTGLRGAVRDAAAAAADLKPQGEFSRAQEREADYVGMYYLARAGIDTGGLGLVWRRLASENLEGVRSGESDTHPSSPERLLLLEAVHREIERKRAAGQPLLPGRAADGALVVPRPGTASGAAGAAEDAGTVSRAAGTVSEAAGAGGA